LCRPGAAGGLGVQRESPQHFLALLRLNSVAPSPNPQPSGTPCVTPKHEACFQRDAKGQQNDGLVVEFYFGSAPPWLSRF